MHSKVFSDWQPSYINATRPVLEILKMDGYFPERPRMNVEGSGDYECMELCPQSCVFLLGVVLNWGERHLLKIQWDLVN
jgi:hypothetical protein